MASRRCPRQWQYLGHAGLCISQDNQVTHCGPLEEWEDQTVGYTLIFGATGSGRTPVRDPVWV
jgi:hypothetical protein